MSILIDGLIPGSVFEKTHKSHWSGGQHLWRSPVGLGPGCFCMKSWCLRCRKWVATRLKWLSLDWPFGKRNYTFDRLCLPMLRRPGPYCCDLPLCCRSLILLVFLDLALRETSWYQARSMSFRGHLPSMLSSSTRILESSPLVPAHSFSWRQPFEGWIKCCCSKSENRRRFAAYPDVGRSISLSSSGVDEKLYVQVLLFPVHRWQESPFRTHLTLNR